MEWIIWFGLGLIGTMIGLYAQEYIFKHRITFWVACYFISTAIFGPFALAGHVLGIITVWYKEKNSSNS